MIQKSWLPNGIEPLFVAYRINLVFSGHVHGYQRSHPAVSEKVDE
jgi:hypothetical protein